MGVHIGLGRKTHDRLYELVSNQPSCGVTFSLYRTTTSLDWHRRLGHPSLFHVCMLNIFFVSLVRWANIIVISFRVLSQFQVPNNLILFIAIFRDHLIPHLFLVFSIIWCSSMIILKFPWCISSRIVLRSFPQYASSFKK